MTFCESWTRTDLLADQSDTIGRIIRELPRLRDSECEEAVLKHVARLVSTRGMPPEVQAADRALMSLEGDYRHREGGI